MTTLFRTQKVIAGMTTAPSSAWLRSCIRLASRLFNTLRLANSPRHARNVRRSRLVLRAIRSFTEPGVAGRCFSYLRQVDPLVFEEVVLSALEDAGLFILRNRRYSGDGGIDGVVWTPTHGWIAVQAKRYRGHIDLQHVFEFKQAIRRGSFDGGLLVHTGRSGKGVREAICHGAVTLLSGDGLLSLIHQRRLSIGRRK